MGTLPIDLSRALHASILLTSSRSIRPHPRLPGSPPGTWLLTTGSTKRHYELEARLRARCLRTLSRLPQSRESHHLRLALRLSSRNIQPHPSPAQTLTLPSFGDVKSSAAERATGHKGRSSGGPLSSLRSQTQM